MGDGRARSALRDKTPTEPCDHRLLWLAPEALTACLRRLAGPVVLGLFITFSPCRTLADQPIPPTTPTPAPPSTPDPFDAFSRGDLATAERLLRDQAAAQPDNFVPHYNLACILSINGDLAGAEESLGDAIERGFIDRTQLRRDPSLANLRNTDFYARLDASWPRILEANRDGNLRLTRDTFSKGYAESRDDALRLAYLNAFDERSFAVAQGEIVRLARWADEHVIPGLLDPAASIDDPWVVVVLPTRPDFTAWAVAAFGPAALGTTSQIGGSYEHDRKRLVSQDLGATLRHEFLHVLHWRDMTRRAQQHPIWIMEGLCSLPEDYDLSPTGDVRPVPSWRTNVAKRLERLGQLQPLEKLAALPHARFTGSRPLANYAQARTLFLHLHDRGKLRAWYEHYTANFKSDPTGVQSILAVLDTTLPDFNKAHRAWVRALPTVPEEIARGMASLGVEIDPGTGDGPVVVSIDRTRKPRPTLRPGDTILSIDGQLTRDIAELVRVLGSYQPGAEATVEYRRGPRHATTTITLIAKP